MENKSRIFLANLNDDHVNRYISLSDDLELVATMGWKPFQGDEKERFIQTVELLSVPYWKKSKVIIFSIVSTAGNKAVGFVSIKGINEAKSFAEIGIAIMDREYRGRGYGTEALRSVVDYAFNELGLILLGLTVFPSNERAITAYEKVGFCKKEFLKNSWLLPSGAYADLWLMELSRDQLP